MQLWYEDPDPDGPGWRKFRTAVVFVAGVVWLAFAAVFVFRLAVELLT